MKLPPRVKEIVHELYRRHWGLAHGPDESRRQLARMIAEQARFELGPAWGHKSADPTRPPSKDAIAWQSPDGHLLAWDLFDGTTREPVADPDSIDITGQHFIDVSPGRDWLGAGTAPPPPPPPPGNSDDDAAELVALVEHVERIADGLTSLRDALAELVALAKDAQANGIRFRLR